MHGCGADRESESSASQPASRDEVQCRPRQLATPKQHAPVWLAKDRIIPNLLALAASDGFLLISTQDRPHRRAKLLEVPEQSTVARQLLETLAALAPEEPRTTHASNGTGGGSRAGNGSGDYWHELMVGRWLPDSGHEFRIKPQPDSRGRTVYVLKQCPFDPSHGDPDSCIMQSADGALSAQCFHSSYSTKGWQEFKAVIGKPAADHYDPPLAPKRESSGKASSTAKAGKHADGQALTDLGIAEGGLPHEW